ncbi:MAG: hypothetical protein C3F13_17960 [Anaerolineales bacterium]|nr:MAG: hypothetical protein C3F13_17960 [Anaerolineales bacterium]
MKSTVTPLMNLERGKLFKHRWTQIIREKSEPQIITDKHRKFTKQKEPQMNADGPHKNRAGYRR